MPNNFVYYHFFKLLVISLSISFNFTGEEEEEEEEEEEKRLVGKRLATPMKKNRCVPSASEGCELLSYYFAALTSYCRARMQYSLQESFSPGIKTFLEFKDSPGSPLGCLPVAALL